MLGAKSAYATDCYNNNYIGANYGINEDLTNKLPENWKEFNQIYIPKYMASHPDKSKIAAGLSCGALWTIAKGLQRGDIVLCPNGAGSYYVGEIISEYFHEPASALQHQRSVKWFTVTIERAAMSEALRNSTGSIGTVSDISSYYEEIESFITGDRQQLLNSIEDIIEDSTAFAMENQLEEFLVSNWQATELGKHYDIFEEDGEAIGRQYLTDTGRMDILAISKDRETLLVVELKRGKASDRVVGQVQRYMGFVKEELAEPGQTVKGAIIALEDDLRIRRALSVAANIDFYRYEISFKLFKN